MISTLDQKTEAAEVPNSEKIDRFLQETPVQEKGALYTVIRMLTDHSSFAEDLVKATEAKFSEVADRSNQRIHKLSDELGLSINELQPYLLAAIERRPVTVDEQRSRLTSLFCTDPEASYFIDRLGLEPTVKTALIQAINDMESKLEPPEYGQTESNGAIEIAQFLQVIEAEMKEEMLAEYWEANVRNHFAAVFKKYNALFDELDAQGIKPAEASKEFVNSRNCNVEYVRQGRDWIQTELEKIIAEEIKIGAKFQIIKNAQFLGHMEYLKSKISPEHWQGLLQALKVNVNDNGDFTFSIAGRDELNKLKFEMERAAAFLNPAYREIVKGEPYIEPELGYILTHR